MYIRKPARTAAASQKGKGDGNCDVSTRLLVWVIVNGEKIGEKLDVMAK